MPICMAATFRVPKGNDPKKLMSRPHKKMRKILDITQRYRQKQCLLPAKLFCHYIQDHFYIISHYITFSAYMVIQAVDGKFPGK